MLRMLVLCLCLVVSACEVGNFPEDREVLHQKNTTDCDKTPHLCHNGVPW